METLEQIMKDNQDLGQSLHLGAERLATAVPMRGTKYTNIVEGVALVDLFGPIYPRANLMTSSGATSISQFTTDFFTAYEDPTIKGIIMNVDSPGGDVRGIGDAAQMIHAVSKKYKKPIYAYAAGYMASAAYYVSSSAQKIYGGKSADVGSVGVVLTARVDKDKRVIEIVSSQSPLKRADASTEEGRVTLQQKVDDFADIFISDVAKYRGVDKSVVLEKYGQGATFVGPRAFKHGMLDGLGTLSSVVEQVLRDSQTGPSRNKSKAIGATFELASILSFSEEDTDMGLKDFAKKYNPLALAKDEQTHSATLTDDESGEAVVAEEGQEQVEIEAGDDVIIMTREQLEEDFSDKAELFVMEQTLASKLLPALQVHAASEFLNAKVDDELHGGTVNFINAKGEVAKGTREEAVRARYEAMPKHSLTQKAIAGVKAGSVQAIVLREADTEKVEDGPMTEARKKELLGLSSQGQAVLNAQNK